MHPAWTALGPLQGPAVLKVIPFTSWKVVPVSHCPVSHGESAGSMGGTPPGGDMVQSHPNKPFQSPEHGLLREVYQGAHAGPPPHRAPWSWERFPKVPGEELVRSWEDKPVIAQPRREKQLLVREGRLRVGRVAACF